MTEIWVDSHAGTPHGSGGKEDPVASVSMALSLLSGQRDKLWLRGVFHDGLKLSGMAPDALVVDGQHDTVFFGFEGSLGGFDPLSPPPRTWGSIGISDCHNITVKNMEMWGGVMQGVHLDDSYPLTGLKNITLDGITVRHAHQRGIFMGGHNIRDLVIKNCTVTDSVFDGPETHGIYLSGGHWREDYGVFDVSVSNCSVSYSFGRHAFQFNGRCRGLKVEGCTFKHAEMAGISLIGVQHAIIRNNTIYGNNRQGIVIYDYGEPQFRHPNRDIKITNNTIYVGPHQWKKDHWHNSKPDLMPAIAVNCHLGQYGSGYHPKGIQITKNVLHTPSPTVLTYEQPWDATGTVVGENLIWASGDTPRVLHDGKIYDLPWLDKNASAHYRGNIYEDPRFLKNPEFEFIDLTNTIFNFETHNSDANLYSPSAAALGYGANIPHPKIRDMSNFKFDTATGEKVGPWWKERE
jgi:parallel beta-helix repeat protein